MEKRTGALPQADIDIARKRFEDFRARMEQPRRPPEACRP
jgi:phage-related protein